MIPEPTSDSCTTRTCAHPSPCLNEAICTNSTSPDFTANEYSCRCPADFFGVGCENFDACSSLQPCLNGGSCTVDLLSTRQFVCSCPPGTSGVSCETLLSPCASSPCLNGGICRDESTTSGEFNCLCLPGFSGERCEVDVDDCVSAPCANGGTCIDGVNSYNCVCPPEFSGEQCHTQLVFCSADLCANNGSCVEEGNGFSCQCQPGWTDFDCRQNVNECENEVCENGGMCVDHPGSFSCRCAAGFTGPLCTDSIDFCASNPCNGNGECLSTSSGFFCQCDAGYTGEMCNQDIDECLSSPCADGATCIHGIDHFTCICPPGSTGLLCDIGIDECSDEPCLNGGSCLDDGLGGFECVCRAGFTGSVCETQFDFCIDDPCLSGGNCSSTESNFHCDCPTGWNGPRCQFVDSVTTKLTLCSVTGATDIFSETLSTTDSVLFTHVSPEIVINYSLASDSLYFSSWVWQEEGSTGTIFSLTDTSDPAIHISLISDPEFSEVTLQYSGTGMGVQELSITNTPLTPRQWHHVAISLSPSSLSLSVDNQMMFNRPITNLLLPTEFNFTVGGAVGEPQFIGIMRGAALYDGALDLTSVEECTLQCAAGDGYCLNGGTCYDQFTQQYLCSCAYGFTGPFCQYQHSRVSFEGSGLARLPELPEPLSVVELEFKTVGATGHILSHSAHTFSVSVGVSNDSLLATVSHCDGQMQQVEISSPAPLTEPSHWHTLSLTNFPTSPTLTISLDVAPPTSLTLINATGCTTAPGFSLGGSTDHQAISGCIRSVVLDSSPLELPQLELSEGAEFGCQRDTAQFFGQSFLRYPPFLSPTSQTISLSLNTRSPVGVVYYSHRLPGDATGDDPIDFLAIHLSSGRLSLSYNLGETTTTISSPASLDDGAWHQIEVALNGTMGVLTVDGLSQEEISPGPLNMLDTTASVLVGGVPLSDRVSSFTEYSHFDGCVRDLELNGDPVDLLTHIDSQNVRFGTCN